MASNDWFFVKCGTCGHGFQVPTGTKPPYSRYCSACALARLSKKGKRKLKQLTRELMKPHDKRRKNPPPD